MGVKKLCIDIAYICVVLMSETLIDIFDYLAWQMQKAALSEEREKERKESNRS